MKIISVLIASIFLHVFSYGQIELKATLSEATVYKNNAKLVSDVSTKLPAGTSEIIIKNVSTGINPSSLQINVKAAGKVSLLSAKYERDYINTNSLSAEQIALKTTLDKALEELKWVREQKNTFTELQTVLASNRALGGANDGLKPEDLSSLLAIYQEKQLSYKKEVLRLSAEEQDLSTETAKLQAQLNELNAIQNKPTGILRLQVSAVQPTQADFKCAYLINNAGWTPIYDLRSEGVNENVALFYKANIYQNSGYNWENVNLTVSTGNPSQSNNKPILYPLYTNYYQAVQLRGGRAASAPEYYEEGIAMSSKKEALDDVEELVFEEANYYENTIQTSTLSVDYELDFKQNIPSDGKVHLVALQRYSLPSVYQYYTVPKLDQSVYLVAKVSEWGQYNLLPGKSNIFFEGAYVGEAYINPNTSEDTLVLSLGKDKGIQIERTALNEFTSTKLIGSNKKEGFSYAITLKNLKTYPVSIKVYDQIPISRQKDIQVSLEEGHGAKFNTEKGELEWTLNLLANESKKLTFTYSIKYPKDRSITGKN